MGKSRSIHWLTGRHISNMVFWALVVFALNCETEEQATVSPSKPDKTPIQEGWNSEIILTKAGKIQAVIRYGYMAKFDESDRVYFDQGVQVDFYDSQGNPTSHLTSDRGEYDEKTEDVMGIGKVEVVSDSGVTLNTESLRLENERNLILSDTTVMVTTSNQDTLYGVGFESNTDLSRWRILKPWGIGNKPLDIDKMEESFREKPEEKSVLPDSLKPDSLKSERISPN
ncbi:LPS export ABC transporter periplasmic protein LptC [bacterium I07]|nr:LPS export ABC transporter periplasmic protein LptC [bacterium I07]